MNIRTFLEVQLKSFKDFLQSRSPHLKSVRTRDCIKYLLKTSLLPIQETILFLEFLDYYIDPPRYTIDDCIERGLTYSVPLKAQT